ncbi:MAG TPA: hypothetical protein VFE51_20115 [Verrucomicrobiae bacterium]|nr:hypothetical protein [Verrucomicrobiae bacterium]
MPDKEYKIRILTVADNSGAKQSAEGLEEVHKGFVHAGNGAREFHHLLERVSEQSPVMGAALRTAISPVGGAFALGIFAARGLEETIKELNASMTTSEWESYSSVVQATVKSFYDSQIVASKFAGELEHIRTAAETASEQVERLSNIHKAQQTAAEKVAQAQEKLELAKAATIQDPVARAEKELEIQNRFAEAAERRAQATERLAKAEEHRKLANEQLNELRLSSELGRARAGLSGLRPEAAIDEQIRIEESRLAAAHADVERVRERIEEIDKHPADPTQFAQLRILKPLLESDQVTEDKQREFVKRLKDARPGEVEAVQAANETVKALEEELKATTQRIKKLKADLGEHEKIAGIEASGRGAVNAIERQTRGFSTGAGGAVFDSAARIQSGHGSETDYAIVNPVMQYLGANNENGSTILSMLASQAGINDAHGAALDALKARIDAQAQKAATRLLPAGG